MFAFPVSGTKRYRSSRGNHDRASSTPAAALFTEDFNREDHARADKVFHNPVRRCFEQSKKIKKNSNCLPTALDCNSEVEAHIRRWLTRSQTVVHDPPSHVRNATRAGHCPGEPFRGQVDLKRGVELQSLFDFKTAGPDRVTNSEAFHLNHYLLNSGRSVGRCVCFSHDIFNFFVAIVVVLTGSSPRSLPPLRSQLAADRWRIEGARARSDGHRPARTRVNRKVGVASRRHRLATGCVIWITSVYSQVWGGLSHLERERGKKVDKHVVLDEQSSVEVRC